MKRMQRIPWLMGIGFWLIAPLAAQFPARLTVEEAVRRAEANHAALAAARARVDIADGLLRQAGVHPNPVLAVLTENWRFYGTPDFAPADDLDITAALRQTFETGGKRDRRVAVARQDGTVASLERDAVAWELRQAVRRAFLRALLAGKLHELQAEQSAFFQQVIDYHQARVAEGVMAEADLVRVRLEGELLAAARDGAKLEADQARVELLRTMGETRFDTEFQLEDPGAGEPRLPPEETTLLALAVEHRLEIRLARAAATKAAAQLELEQALAKPDWELEAGYKRTGGFNTLVAGVSVPLPFFNRNLGGIAAAGAATRHADAQLRLAEAQVRADVAQAVDNLRRRHAILQRMHQGMLDWAEQSWNIALSAYREGGLDLLRLLEAHRTRNEVLNRHTQAEMEYRLGWVDLETAVGTEMSAGTGQ